MNYFDKLSCEQKKITVLGASEGSELVKELRILFGDKEIIAYGGENGRLRVHTEEEIAAYKAEGMLIGVVDVNIAEKKICEVIDGAEDFCNINDLTADELIFQRALARVIEEREKYDLLYINNVDSEAKRLFARELAKCCSSKMGIRLINTDSSYVETLVKLS